MIPGPNRERAVASIRQYSLEELKSVSVRIGSNLMDATAGCFLPTVSRRNDGLLRLLCLDLGSGFCPPTRRSLRVSRAGGGKKISLTKS